MPGIIDKIASKLRLKNFAVRVAFAEFLGTSILIIFGDGSVAQSVLSKSSKGEFLSINWSWCMAVTIGVFSSINVSGGHLNPAVSLAMSIIGRLPWKLLPVYFLAQYIGAFTGAALVYAVYYEAIQAFDGGVRVTDPANSTATAGIFATYPQAYLSAGEGFTDQVVGTMMLVLAVMAVSDKRNAQVPKCFVPVIVGFTVLVIGTSYGFNCGYGINPARDLGPRIFTSAAGWGIEPFSYRNYNWFWVPILGPHIGAIIGAWIYLLLVEFHWEDNSEAEENVKIISQGYHNEALGENAEAKSSVTATNRAWDPKNTDGVKLGEDL